MTVKQRTAKYDSVILGFLEPPEEHSFHPANFASKVGGKPVWLYRGSSAPPPVPRCALCLQPQIFLLQVYAPIEQHVVGHDEAFHRMLYVAICNAPGCLKDPRCVTVLRAQLARHNHYYPFDAQHVDADACAQNLEHDVTPQCCLCGFLGQSRCGSCKKVMYCSRRCQSIDWNLGHKKVCRRDTQRACQEDVAALEGKRSEWLYKEFEIVTDRHPSVHSGDDEDDDSSDDGEEEVERGESKSVEQGGTFQDADEEELPEDLFQGRGDAKKDDVFTQFNKVVSYAPDQVIRYERDGRVLWGSSVGNCDEYGACEMCGERRVFEFQVMPQLVYLLGNAKEASSKLSIGQVASRLRDDMDWATIVVSTCRNSCAISSGSYVKEVAWMQQHTRL